MLEATGKIRSLISEVRKFLLAEDPRFRTPTSKEEAKSLLNRTKRNLKKAQAELEDAERSQYPLGVKIARDRIEELQAAIVHFEAWIKANK